MRDIPTYFTLIENVPRTMQPPCLQNGENHQQIYTRIPPRRRRAAVIFRMRKPVQHEIRTKVKRHHRRYQLITIILCSVIYAIIILTYIRYSHFLEHRTANNQSSS